MENNKKYTVMFQATVSVQIDECSTDIEALNKATKLIMDSKVVPSDWRYLKMITSAYNPGDTQTIIEVKDGN